MSKYVCSICQTYHNKTKRLPTSIYLYSSPPPPSSAAVPKNNQCLFTFEPTLCTLLAHYSTSISCPNNIHQKPIVAYSRTPSVNSSNKVIIVYQRTRDRSQPRPALGKSDGTAMAYWMEALPNSWYVFWRPYIYPHTSPWWLLAFGAFPIYDSWL